MTNYFSILKNFFRVRPTLDEWISSHNPTDNSQVDQLVRNYEQFIQRNTFNDYS